MDDSSVFSSDSKCFLVLILLLMCVSGVCAFERDVCGVCWASAPSLHREGGEETVQELWNHPKCQDAQHPHGRAEQHSRTLNNTREV